MKMSGIKVSLRNQETSVCVLAFLVVALLITINDFLDIPYVLASSLAVSVGLMRSLVDIFFVVVIGIIATFIVFKLVRQSETMQEELSLRAQLLDSATDSIFLYTRDGKFVYMNEAAYKSRGYTRLELMAKNRRDLDTPEYARLFEQRMRQITEEHDTTFESVHIKKDGSLMSVELHARIIHVGREKLVLSVVRDVHKRRLVEDILRQHVRELSLLNEFTQPFSKTGDIGEISRTALNGVLGALALPIGCIYIFDEASGDYLLVSHKGLAYETALALRTSLSGNNHNKVERIKIGPPLTETLASIPVADIDEVNAKPEEIQSIVSVPLRSRGRTVGILLICDGKMGLLSTEDIRFLETLGRQVGVAIDNTQLFEKLNLLSITDDLTGLPNRRHFYQTLEAEIYRSRRYGAHFCLAMVDIDSFKQYNDRFGHAAGDAVLKLLAGILKSNLRKSDIAFRYGGDEFTIIILSVDSAGARKIMDRIMKKYSQKVKTEIPVLNSPTGFSVGIASFPENIEEGDGLVFLADAALYYSKRSGGHRSTLISEVKSLWPDMLSSATLEQISTLAAMVDARDRLSYGHSKRVADIAKMIGQSIGLSEAELASLHTAALLHDIGKISIESSILAKPGRLSAEEWAIIKQHPVDGATISAYIKGQEGLVPLIRHHHERYDGTGYPDSLRAESIPLGARIISIADAYDTMISPRSYRNIVSREEAISEIVRCSGSQFDPGLASVFRLAIAGAGALT